MELVARADDQPERISIARCRELLGEEAGSMFDEDVNLVSRHAETMAVLVVELYREIGEIAGSCRAAETRLVGIREWAYAAGHPAFNYLRPIETGKEGLVNQTGFEPFDAHAHQRPR